MNKGELVFTMAQAWRDPGRVCAEGAVADHRVVRDGKAVAWWASAPSSRATGRLVAPRAPMSRTDPGRIRAARRRAPMRTIRTWEQGKRGPTGAARALFRILDKAPETALRVLG